MKKKIFSSVLLTVFVFAGIIAAHILTATLIGVSTDALVKVAFFSCVVALTAATLLARFFSKMIVAPIEKIDPDNPKTDKSYVEIDSLIRKISRQNHLIDLQMQDLRRHQVEFSAITENMSEGIIILDNKSEILSYNSAACRLLGAEKVKEGEHFISLSRSRRFVSTVSEAFEGRNAAGKMTMGQRVFEIFANPVKIENEQSGVVIVIMDITETEKREEMRREFSSNVSHELKTPLTTISGISQLFMGGIVSKEDIPKFAKNIHDEADRLLNLINDIIKLSRLDEAIDPELPDKVDLFDLSGEIVNRLLMAATERDIELSLEGGSSFVEGNRSILAEMIYNLTDNAIKYNKEGGSVKISVGKENGNPVVSVSDSGIGIAPEHQSRIFERFYRVDKSHSREIGGTGLGLSIVKHSAEYHRATLSLESRVGVGTKITVTFPNPAAESSSI